MTAPASASASVSASVSASATRWAWSALTGSRLDAPHRLTLLAAARLQDLADAHAAAHPATGRRHHLTPGDLTDTLTDTDTGPGSETGPGRSPGDGPGDRAPLRRFAPAELARQIGVTDRTALLYCRYLAAGGLLETTDRRTFTLPHRSRDPRR